MKANKLAMMLPIIMAMSEVVVVDDNPKYTPKKKVRDCTICGTDIFSNDTVVCSAKCYKTLVKRNKSKQEQK